MANISLPDSITSIGTNIVYNTAYYDNSENWDGGVLYISNYIVTASKTLSGHYVIKSGTKIVASYAFNNCENLTGLTMPSSVVKLGSSAFTYCAKLSTVNYLGTLLEWFSIDMTYSHILASYDRYSSVGPPTLRTASLYINNKVLSGSIVIPEGVTRITDGIFYNSNITSITIPSSVQYVGAMAFSGCYNLSKVYYNGSISDWCKIEWALGEGGYNYTASPLQYASQFYINNRLVTNIIIPNEVTTINRCAFMGYKGLKEIYYQGTEEDWNRIEIGSSNDIISSATRYYYSESRPAETGNYWHYDSDGVTVIKW